MFSHNQHRAFLPFLSQGHQNFFLLTSLVLCLHHIITIIISSQSSYHHNHHIITVNGQLYLEINFDFLSVVLLVTFIERSLKIKILIAEYDNDSTKFDLQRLIPTILIPFFQVFELSLFRVIFSLANQNIFQHSHAVDIEIMIILLL